MASAQEFFSPGEHMASISGSVNNIGGSARSHGPNDFIDKPHSQVIYAPHYDNINNGFEDYYNSHYRGSARDISDDFNRSYMDYNQGLFNSAKEYDMYMSNTAIQRQVEDLKKAGLNPILAARLGGATYKGVNAPYLNISPASALNSFLDYGATMYSADLNSTTQREIAQLQTSSNRFISQYEATIKMIMQGNEIQAEKELVNLKKYADEYLENVKYTNDVVLQNLGFRNQKDVEDFKNKLNKDYLDYKRHTGIYSSNDPYIFVANVSRMIPGARGILLE